MIHLLSNINGFDWDEGNIDKNEITHNVRWTECEQIFFNKPLLLLKAGKHSSAEKRYYAYGKTDEGRFLTIVFTLRNNMIRVISARTMSEKERRRYGKEKKI